MGIPHLYINDSQLHIFLLHANPSRGFELACCASLSFLLTEDSFFHIDPLRLGPIVLFLQNPLFCYRLEAKGTPNYAKSL